ncbi:MAG: aminoacyl-tRNA hydrolase [Deltaproteobacteria bacterium]|nr:aminoacyl-tRNA hydrolase [Deltaproteobacteria bacterium]
MKLCVGLGNPGEAYATTRHNIGFLILDAFARCCAGELTKKRFYGTWAQVEVAGTCLGLLKPQTFMNISGKSVAECLGFLQIPPAEMLVIHDELDLELGEMKLSWNRGAAGHRGVESIAAALGTRAFWRLRVGIGRPPVGSDPTEYVLAPIARGVQGGVDAAIHQACQVIEQVCTLGPVRAQEMLHREGGGANESSGI